MLDAIGFQRGLLVGHSDGASIAAIYAGSHQDHRVRGLVLMAPHFICEDVTAKSIAEARDAYDNGDLRARLQKCHPNVDNAFRGWADVWLDNDFRQWDISEELAYIRVPILIVQGEDDQYGTVRQIEIAQEECYCPVDVALLPGVKHNPAREAPEVTLSACRTSSAASCMGTRRRRFRGVTAGRAEIRSFTSAVWGSVRAPVWNGTKVSLDSQQHAL